MFSFVQHRRYYFAFSGVLIALGLLAMIISLVTTGAPFQIGVDFQSGTRFEVRFTEPATEDQIREVFRSFGLANPAVTALAGGDLENTWQIRTEFLSNEEASELERLLSDQVAPVDSDATLVESVSPAVGQEVTRAAFGAILLAAIIVLGYIMFAFRQMPHSFRYGACAVLAMLHDILIIFSFIAITGLLLGWQVDALFLTATLTVAGFSLQDTIVVFDRIRENFARRPLENFDSVANRSLLETLHRSLATQLCAMFVLVALLLFGGASIRHFIGVMFIGLLSGTYSSLFTAVPLLSAWENRAARRAAQ
jgi:preprotein translocase SecF subunit